MDAKEAAETEEEAMLRRAFSDGKADYIIITSRRERRQIESANYGVDPGWLVCNLEGADSQSSVLVCQLTGKGRRYFDALRAARSGK